jgi:hypothetical protein
LGFLVPDCKSGTAGIHSIYFKKMVFSTELEALQLIIESVAESYRQSWAFWFRIANPEQRGKVGTATPSLCE